MKKKTKLSEIIKLKNDNIEYPNVKILRHVHNRLKLPDNKSLKGLWTENKDDVYFYQEHQRNDIFKGVDVILSFIGSEGTEAKFIGAFEVKSREKILDKNYSEQQETINRKALTKGAKYIYKLERINKLDGFIGELVIEWGKAPVVWHQWHVKNGVLKKDKTIVSSLD